jgi:hypothetical protein
MVFNGLLVELSSANTILDIDDTPAFWSVAATIAEVGKPFFFKDPKYLLTDDKMPLYEAGQDVVPDRFCQGEKVLIDYTALFDPIRIDNKVFIKHTDVICKLNPIRAVNGNIIVLIDDDTDVNRDGVIVSYDRRKVEGFGFVVSMSFAKRKHYDNDIPFKASKVWFRSGWRIESDIIRSYGPLACVNPRDVYAFQP